MKLSAVMKRRPLSLTFPTVKRVLPWKTNYFVYRHSRWLINKDARCTISFLSWARAWGLRSALSSFALCLQMYSFRTIWKCPLPASWIKNNMQDDIVGFGWVCIVNENAFEVASLLKIAPLNSICSFLARKHAIKYCWVVLYSLSNGMDDFNEEISRIAILLCFSTMNSTSKVYSYVRLKNLM